MTKPVILIDGSSYLYRAFHALPPLMNSKNQPTGAIYGVLSMLKKMIQEFDPDIIAMIFDSKEKTFRDELYEAYKANREAMPNELQSQIQPLYDIIEAMGIPLVVIHGVEADDVIGTLAKQLSDHGEKVIISTGDKDMAQLVNKNITLINTMNNSHMDEKGVTEKFGVNPSQIIDYLTLVGDTSDNVPGVPGVGPKTAAKWLTTYHSLDNLVKHRQELTGKIKEVFEKCISQFDLTKTLVTIKCDVSLPFKPHDLKKKSPDHEKLTALYQALEFKSLLSENLSKTSPKKNIKNYHCVLDKKDFEKLVAKLKHSNLFSVDTETTSLHIIDAKIVGISLGFENGEAYYIPLKHDYMDAPQQLEFDYVLSTLKPILEGPKSKIAHNIKYDKNIFLNHGINIQNVLYDTMLESYVLDSTATRHDMDSLALKYLGKKTIHFEDVAGTGAKQLTFNQVGIKEAAEYAAEDADITFQLHETLWPRLEKNPGSVKTFQEIEMPLTSILGEMERHGVLIDAKLLEQQSKSLATQISHLEKEAYQEVGQQFNLASPKQLQEILYDKMQLPVLEKTPSGQPSTAENVLQELAQNYTLPKIILNHRTLSKLKSTYTDRLPEQIHPKTGRVHTSYHQANTSTGRLSSANPNLQNIPIRTEEGRTIRKAFIVPPGYKMLSADYSQIELRLMAHLSQDESLLNAFAHGLDIHVATAAEIFNIELKSVTSEQRRYAKTINFGLIYGMSAFGLAKQLDVPRETAQAYIDTYFTRYPGVKKYMEDTKKLAHKQGFVTTLFDRQLYLPDINARNMMRQRGAERAAINAPLQGTAADLIKTAMINIRKENLPATMIMQVHDELIFEVREEELQKSQEEIKHLMENVFTLSVPLVVNIGIGNNWDEAH